MQVVFGLFLWTGELFKLEYIRGARLLREVSQPLSQVEDVYGGQSCAVHLSSVACGGDRLSVVGKDGLKFLVALSVDDGVRGYEALARRHWLLVLLDHQWAEEGRALRALEVPEGSWGLRSEVVRRGAGRIGRAIVCVH